jgi:hypothetical protein
MYVPRRILKNDFKGMDDREKKNFECFGWRVFLRSRFLTIKM